MRTKDPIDAYLDELAAYLEGSRRRRRRILNEIGRRAERRLRAALAATAVVTLGERVRASKAAAVALAGGLFARAALGWVILGETPRFLSGLRWVVLASAACAIGGVALLARSRANARSPAVTTPALVLAALTTLLTGPTAYSFATGLYRCAASDRR